MADNFFTIPFAENGDRTDVPTDRPVDNSVNMQDGYSFDYEKEPPAPGYKFIERKSFNGLIHQVTSAIRDAQLHGVSDWMQSVVNVGGYAKNALVWHQGNIWQSQVDNNGIEPGADAEQWMTLPDSIAATIPPAPGGGGNPISIDGPLIVTKGSSANYTITDYDSFLTYSVSTTVGTVSRTGATITLTIPAGVSDAAAVLTITRDGASETREVALGEQSIAQPTITSPASGAINVSVAPTIVGSPFTTYPNGADTHLNTDWYVRNAGGTIIFQSLADATNKTSISIPLGTLQPGTQYFATVAYRGATLGLSPLSAPVQFTTIAQSINTPAILSPANGATDVGETPTITSSVFATTPSGADVHVSTNWRLKNQSGVIVWSSTNDTVNKTSITIPKGILAVSSNYTIESQYNGASLPPSSWSAPNTFTTSNQFYFDKYLALASDSTPYVLIYGQDIDTFTKLENPSVLPTGPSSGVAFSSDGTYMAVTCNSSPYITIYKRSGDTFTKLANPSVLPTGSSRGVAFSSDGTYMAVAHVSSPYITIYKRSGDTFTKLANPSSLPNSDSYGVAFSSDGDYMAVTYFLSPFITIYKRSGDTFTKLANPSVLPNGYAAGVAFSSDGTYMAVAHNSSSSPYITIYKRSGDTFTKLANPSVLPTGNSRGVAFSPDGTYMAVAHVSSPYITIYKRSGDTFTKLANPSSLPNSDSIGVAFSSDGDYMAVTYFLSPFITIYKRSGDTFTKLANPSVLPGGTSYSVCFYPG